MFAEREIDEAVERLVAIGHTLLRIDTAPWLVEPERRFGTAFPATFHALYGRYIFPLLEHDEVTLFANEGAGSRDDFVVRLFADRYMGPWLRDRRLLYLGHPHLGNYDPVCLDLTTGSPNPPVVQLDHEDILQERPTVRREALFPSFLHLLRRLSGA